MYKFTPIFSGICRYLNGIHDVAMPPSQEDYCTVSTAVIRMSTFCSTYFIVNMTFERFYSIIRPHKAASFNTVKRAKITIVFIVTFCVIFNIPHFYITATDGARCGPFGKAMKTRIGKAYYYISLFTNLALPFVSLLAMNSFIIREIHRRPNLSQSKDTEIKNKGQGQSEGQTSRIKSSDMQIFIILLLVTFSYLILSTPAYAYYLYINIANYMATPKIYAGYLLFHSVVQKLHLTNYGINFCLYVISGQKFRADLVKLFVKEKTPENSTSVSTIFAY